MKTPALLLIAALVLPASAMAQTRDQARLIFNVSAGFIGGSTIWHVDDQPLYDDFAGETLIDTLRITRKARPTLTLGARGIYFHNDNLGFFGEAFLLGLGYDDGCSRRHATSSTRNAEVCSTLDQSESAASAVEVGAGAMYRVASRKTVSPYARAGIGITVASRSTLSTSGFFNSAGANSELVEVPIYKDEGLSQLYLSGTLGAGFTAQVAPGYQLRWEVRDNMVRLPTVTGPSVQDGSPPVVTNRVRHLFSMEIGFDVVLERRHGRRY
jgi:opacity protein-like surface antigen